MVGRSVGLSRLARPGPTRRRVARTRSAGGVAPALATPPRCGALPAPPAVSAGTGSGSARSERRPRAFPPASGKGSAFLFNKV